MQSSPQVKHLGGMQVQITKRRKHKAMTRKVFAQRIRSERTQDFFPILAFTWNKCRNKSTFIKLCTIVSEWLFSDIESYHLGCKGRCYDVI